MNNKRIIIGVTIGIIAAILWSVVFINVLNNGWNWNRNMSGYIFWYIWQSYFSKKR